MAAAPLYFVRRDEDWILTATMSATSEQTGFEAAKAKTDDPSEPWWANSVSATLTATFTGAKEVGLIALIMNNADDGKVITVAGGITGSPTMTGKREKSGYPRDLALIIDPPQTLSAITFAISSNTNKWSIGRVVAGKRRSIRNFLDSGFQTEYVRGQEVDEGIPQYVHTIHYDVGGDHWKAEGSVLLIPADFVIAHDWWSAQKMGVHPTLVVPDLNNYPPLFADMHMGERKTKEGNFDVPLSFLTVGRGEEVVG